MCPWQQTDGMAAHGTSTAARCNVNGGSVFPRFVSANISFADDLVNRMIALAMNNMVNFLD
jgi:hypothetical protein